jgi:hypothetical protein
MRRISFHRLAERELNDTALYYDLESPGLGVTFLDAVEKTLVSMLESATRSLAAEPETVSSPA